MPVQVKKEHAMPKFVIERDMPDVGKLTPTDLRDASRKSREVLDAIGPDIQWINSYVTDDKIYCVYLAGSEATVRRHAEMSGFPANRVSRVHAVIEPATAE